MSTTSADFETLLNRLRLGDEEAAWQLVYEYGPHVMAVVRRRMNRQIRVRLDSQDLAQAVWKSFFVDIACMSNIRSPEELIGHLVRMTQHKLVDAYRRHLYAANNGAVHERPLVLEDSEGERIASPDATPSQFAIMRERWQKMLADATPVARKILRRRMKGEAFEDIAASLGISARTAKRAVAELWDENSHDTA
jgi:DNA-directed RNA polymerase specialized sigma24 family protein